MWVVINNQDITTNIRPGNFSLDMSLGDPLTTATFEVVDTTSTLALDFNQNVMIWDENAAPDYSINGFAVQCVPTLNLVIDPSFTQPTTNYTYNITNGSTMTVQVADAHIVFSNAPGTGTGNSTGMTQAASVLAPGYITPGQKYIFSLYINATANTNISAFLSIYWLDVNRNYLSQSVGGPNTIPTGQARYNVTGVAPSGAVYAQVGFGLYATNTTNSGTFDVGTLQLEPVWFNNNAMGNGSVISYPSPDCNLFQVNTYLMPDGTYARNNRLFYGYIANLEATYEGKKRTYKVDCRAMGDMIENGGIGTPIDVSYTAFTDVEIINDLVSTYYPGLLSTGTLNSSLPLTTLVSGPVIDSVSFTDQTLREILNNLIDISGYTYYIDAYMHLRYHPVPYDYSLFTLLSSSSNIPDYLTTFPPHEYTYIKDGTQIRNSVKITGGNFQVTVQDVFSGDGVTKLFNLSNIPVSIISISENGGSTIYAPTSGNKIGVQGQDVNGVSGIVALMDASNSKVAFNTAPASGTNNVVIDYTQNRPVSILVEENTSIGKYNRRFVSKVNDSTLSSNAAGKVRGESEIAQWAYPVQNITFKLSSEMGTNWQPINMFLRPGMTIFLTSDQDLLTNQPFVIQTAKVTTMGGGVNIYEYEGGVYRPKMNDHIRNVQKALARNPSTGGSTPIQLTYEVLRDQLLYSDRVTATSSISNGTYFWGIGTYGGATFG